MSELETPTIDETSVTITDILTKDHARIDALLTQALGTSGEIDLGFYNEFRCRLLRHIGIEEKLLLPYARNGKDPALAELAAKLRIQHGAIAALLVLDPSVMVIEALRYIFAIHNPLEENPHGFYSRCDELAASELNALLILIASAPEVPLAIRPQNEMLNAAARRSLVRAGFPETLLDR